MTSKTQLLTTLFLLAVTVGIGVPHNAYAEESDVSILYHKMKETKQAIKALHDEIQDIKKQKNKSKGAEREAYKAQIEDKRAQKDDLKLEYKRLNLLYKIAVIQDGNNISKKEKKKIQKFMDRFQATYSEDNKQVATTVKPTDNSDNSPSLKSARTASTSSSSDVNWSTNTWTRDNSQCVTIDDQSAQLTGTLDFLWGDWSKLTATYDFPDKIYEKQSAATCVTYDFTSAWVNVYEIGRTANWCVQSTTNNDASLASYCSNIDEDEYIVVLGNGVYGEGIQQRNFATFSLVGWAAT